MPTAIPDLDVFRGFFLEDFETASEEIERTGRVPDALLRAAAELGAFRLTIPPQYGGFGLDVVQALPYLEAAAMGPAAGRMLVHVLNGMWRPLARFGSVQQQALITQMGSAAAIVGIAVTERDGGSGRDLHTAATRADGAWHLRGEKYLITYADIADHIIVLAASDEARGRDSFSTFLVPTSAAGVQTWAEPTIGLAGIGLGGVRLDVRLDDSHLLGEVGQGFAVLATFLDYSRVSLSACMVGFGQRCLDEAVAFAKQRVTFGKPIAERQAIQMHLADMYARLLAARAMVHQVAQRSLRESDVAAEAAATKMFCADAATWMADSCLRIHGGFGLTSKSIAQRLVRDSRSWWMEEGTAEIQALLIARHLLR